MIWASTPSMDGTRSTWRSGTVPSKEIKNYVPKDKGWSVTTGRLQPKPSTQPSDEQSKEPKPQGK
jgi:hypothetical protein